MPRPHPTVSLIVAVAANGVIGIENRLPWRLPEDLKYFRSRTLGHPIIMGRKTWESLPQALPGRRNLVVSRNPSLTLAGAECFSSLDAAVAACAGADELFVIGGEQVYREALPRADRLYVTRVEADFEGDAFFPAIVPSEWEEISCTQGQSASGMRFAFSVLERVSDGSAAHRSP